MRVTGTDFICAVVQPATNSAGSIVLQLLNSPDPVSTRLAQFAPLYERWKARVYRYRFNSALPTTALGTLIMGQDPDPIGLYSSAVATVSRLRCLPGSQMFHPWDNASCELPTSRDYTSLWTQDSSTGAANPDDRLHAAGQMVMAIASPTNVSANSALGTLELEYDIEFYSPRLGFSDLSKSTPIKLPPSIFPITGISAAKPIIQTAVNHLVGLAAGSATKKAVTAVLGTMIQGYKPFDEAKALTDDLSDVGFPKGDYTARFTFCSNSTSAASATVVVGSTVTNAYYVDGMFSDAIPTMDGTTHIVWYAPDGTGYKQVTHVYLSWGSDQHCYADQFLTRHINVTAVWSEISFASFESYLDATSTSYGPLPRKRLPISTPLPSLDETPESKEEVKDDFFTLSPPRTKTPVPIAPTAIVSASSSSSMSLSTSSTSSLVTPKKRV